MTTGDLTRGETRAVERTDGISVVVATYQRLERLGACLDGLRAQTRPAQEVLVMVHVSDELTAARVDALAREWPALRRVQVDRPGTVASYNLGLATARGAIVAYVDDDAVPEPDWLERIAATFAADPRIAAVGGRDVIIENGRVLDTGGTSGRRASAPIVGRLQWFGRMLGNHHVGVGAPRDVDLIKGVNMSFRRSAVANIGFDERLRGRGAQMHSELSICLPLRRRRLRVVYDPEIVVAHYPSPRVIGQERAHVADHESVFASAHNEALAILDHFGAARRLVYAAWGVALGTTEAPGVAVLGRELLARRRDAWLRFVAAQRGRAAAWRTRRTARLPGPGAPVPAVGVGTPRRLHILRVADVPRRATTGVSGYMLSSGAAIERHGHDVSFWFQDELAPGIRQAGLRRLLVPWVIVARVVRAVRSGVHFDVVEIHEPLAGAYGLVAKLLPSRLPACAALSHGLSERYWQAELAHLAVYGRTPPLKSRALVPLTLLSQADLAVRTADAVLVTSTVDRDYLIERKRLRPERVTCSFGGVSEDLFEVVRTTDADVVRMLFLGSWIERKGTLELVAAWRRLAAERPNVTLTIAGAGDLHAAGEELSQLPRLRLVPEVGRDALPDLLARHDVFVLPSWFEGMPLAMLEAAAAGLACVVSSLCGNLDVFRPEQPERDGAILIPPNDADALHRALITLVDDPALRAALGTRARARARNFTWSANAQRTLTAYAAVTERRLAAVFSG